MEPVASMLMNPFGEYEVGSGSEIESFAPASSAAGVYHVCADEKQPIHARKKYTSHYISQLKGAVVERKHLRAPDDDPEFARIVTHQYIKNASGRSDGEQ